MTWAEELVRKTTIVPVQPVAALLERDFARTLRIVNDVASMQGMEFPSEQEWNGHRLACEMIRKALESGRE